MCKSLSRYYKSVKRPCKICYQTVKPKNGLQCMGACRAWVHYQCLNYTPGKICDIKKGLIEITCPCPDCEIGKSKELRADALYSIEDVAYEGYETSHAQNVTPIFLAPSGSVTECTENDSEHTPMLVQQVREPVLHTNQWAQMTVQPKTYGIDISCSPTSLVDGDPNSGHLMEEAMETISELSQKLQGLMMQIKLNPGVYSPSHLPWLHVQPTQSQKCNTAVVEWTRNEPIFNDTRNSSKSTIKEADVVIPQQDPTVVNQFRVYDHQVKIPINEFVVHKKCCYYYNDPHVHCQ